MPHHPSLEEVIEDRSSYEWLALDLTGFSFGTFADSENGAGNVVEGGLNLYSSSSQSEYGTIEFKKATLGIKPEQEGELNNLIGRHPLGAVNYYDPHSTCITIKIPERAYNNLMVLLTKGIENLSIKVAVAIWNDASAKCLPILKYQLIYESECKI